MALPTRLRTGRLRLRPPEQTDRPAVIAGLNTLSISRWLGRVPRPFHPTLQAGRKRLDSRVRSRQHGGEGEGSC